MRYILLIAALVLTLSPLATAGAKDGIAKRKSAHDMETTISRLEDALKEKGMEVVARIDHAKNVAEAGMKLRPKTLILFSYPKMDAGLLMCNQMTAMDLPQKMLVWQDKDGQVWVSYNTARYLNERYDLNGCVSLLKQDTITLHLLAVAATMPER